MYPGNPGIIMSNPSVLLCPNEKDLETFEIEDAGILMVTHSEIIHRIMIWVVEEKRKEKK